MLHSNAASKLSSAALIALAIGCVGCPGGTPKSSPDAPYRDTWKTVIDEAPFPTVDPMAAIFSLRVGGHAKDDNFVNRGDIEVYFTGPEEKITVEMRRFIFADESTTDEKVDEEFGRIKFWAYAITDAEKPSAEIEPDICTGDAWKENCMIRVYYDGLTQPLRSGADFRVTVPASWRGSLTLVTEDALEEAEKYPDRGDVTVMGFQGPIDVEMDSGRAKLQAAANADEDSVCTHEENETCDDASWDPAGGCTCTNFTRVGVETREPHAADVIVDIPSDIWCSTVIENTQPALSEASDPLCTAELIEADFGDVDYLENDKPWKIRAELNDPGDGAIEGAGFVVDVNSTGCTLVDYVDSPDDYGMPKSEARGFVELCSGCLDLQAP